MAATHPVGPCSCQARQQHHTLFHNLGHAPVPDKQGLNAGHTWHEGNLPHAKRNSHSPTHPRAHTIRY